MSHNNFKILSCFSILLILFSGCTQQIQNQQNNQSQDLSEKAKQDCINLCQSEKIKGTDLSNGPCLSDAIVEDWVCDVAHNPREAADNNPENQCPAFGQGQAHHFVEVDSDCNFIKKY